MKLIPSRFRYGFIGDPNDWWEPLFLQLVVFSVALLAVLLQYHCQQNETKLLSETTSQHWNTSCSTGQFLGSSYACIFFGYKRAFFIIVVTYNSRSLRSVTYVSRYCHMLEYSFLYEQGKIYITCLLIIRFWARTSAYVFHLFLRINWNFLGSCSNNFSHLFWFWFFLFLLGFFSPRC